MTAEIAVMNSIGVALAADSAVSIGGDARKIFTSSDKLFQLSLSQPIGVMIYGNAALCGVPWETVIKEYRASAPKRPFRTIEAQAKTFLDFLETRSDLLSRDAQQRSVSSLIELFLATVREGIRQEINKAAESQDGLDTKQVAGVIDACIGQQLEKVKAAPLVRRLGANPKKSIAARYRSRIEAARTSIFANLPMSSVTHRRIFDMTVEVLSRRYFGPMKTGLVFAGFGTEEFLPALVSFEIESVVCGKVRAAIRHQDVIRSDGTQAVVVPFAQQEMVRAFMEGIDERLERKFKDATSSTLKSVVHTIVESIKGHDAALATRLDSVMSDQQPKILGELFKQWKQSSSQHWGPIVDIVRTLPKDELAAMAEALVNLTKFKRRVTPERETVGGPIDVAVITRGDGFVWIKRKHYFDPGMNPRFITSMRNV